MKKIIILVATVTIALSAFVGCSNEENSAGTKNNQIAVEATETSNSRPMAKVAVNISGEITEISEDGNKIKVDDQWVIITEETKFEDDPDNGIEPVSRDFEIGNHIAGYTMDDPNNSEVIAYCIYSNGKF